MERYAKGFRSFGGFLILLNLINFFLPLTRRTQEGYNSLCWSQFQYVRALFRKSLPYVGEKIIPVTGAQVVLILCCMVLPLILVLAAGIWGIVGSPRQRGSSILVFVILILYILLAVFLESLWPEAQLTQDYVREIASPLTIAVTGCSGVMAVLALIGTPRKVRKVQEKIPQVQEIKQQQIEAKYSIMLGPGQQEASVSEGGSADRKDSSIPRGVMVGLSGVYVGAEIPMTDGEYIHLGRQKTNHLVFEGQAKVSRDHCKIKWDAAQGKFIIFDYSSTGSFVKGSHDCLPQNLEMPLEPGTIIAIGDDTNTFRLE